MASPARNLERYYIYDPLDRLTGAGSVRAVTAQRFYQEGRLVSELDTDSQTTIFRHQAQALAQHRSAAGVIDTLILMTDRSHSVCRAYTEGDEENFSYTAYGYHDAAGSLVPLLGFNGECPDILTGHYPLGAGNRFYIPKLMRFNRPDIRSPFDEGGINAYAYCEGDPINFSDPTGSVKLPFVQRALAELASSRPTVIRHTSTSLTTGASTSARRSVIVSNPQSLTQFPGTAAAQQSVSRPSGSSVSLAGKEGFGPNRNTGYELATPVDLELPRTRSNFPTSLNPNSEALWKRRLVEKGQRYDQLLNTDGFETVATATQRKNIKSLRKLVKRRGATAEEVKKLKARLRFLELRIKNNSVDYHLSPGRTARRIQRVREGS